MYKRFSLIIILIMSGALIANGQNYFGKKPQSEPQDKPTISYAELIRDAAQYTNGQTVRVKATYYIGYETSALGDKDNTNVATAWLDYAKEEDRCPNGKNADQKTSSNKVKINPQGGSIDVIVTGQLLGPGQYGHLGAYSYNFVATCLEDVSPPDQNFANLSEPVQIIQKEGRFVFTDNSSYYLLKKDGTFKSGPLNNSGRVISGTWKLQDRLFVIKGEWSWVNGVSQKGDYRQMIIHLGSPSSSEMAQINSPEFGTPAAKIYKCYFEIEELKKVSNLK